MKSIDDLLAELPSFEGLDAPTRGLLAGCADLVHYRHNELVFGEGQDADHFYVVRQGTVLVEVDAPGRTPAVIESLGSGELLGVSWLMAPYKNTFDARAVDNVSAIRFDATCMRSKCESDPVLGFAMYKLFAGVIRHRLQSARVRLLDLYASDVG